jgi:RNA polymerase primary sigma factor
MGRGVGLEDLIGAGNVGLVEAAHRFDPNRGVKFCTYAAWWIRKAIIEALESSGSVVTIPRYSFERRRRVLEAIASRRRSGQRDTGVRDVAPGLGLSTRQAENAMAFPMFAVSLDTPTSPDSGQCWGDQLARPPEEGSEAIVLEAERMRAARQAMRVLSTRQRVVILLRYGSAGDQPLSLEDVGRVMGISRERVRQIESQALEAVRLKLRRSRPDLKPGHQRG